MGVGRRRRLKQESGEKRVNEYGMEEGKGVRKAARASVEGVREILWGGEREGWGVRGGEGDVRMRVRLVLPDDLDGLMALDGKMMEVRLAGRKARQANMQAGRQVPRQVGKEEMDMSHLLL